VRFGIIRLDVPKSESTEVEPVLTLSWIRCHENPKNLDATQTNAVREAGELVGRSGPNRYSLCSDAHLFKLGTERCDPACHSLAA
jgi:hypothetical protein